MQTMQFADIQFFPAECPFNPIFLVGVDFFKQLCQEEFYSHETSCLFATANCSTFQKISLQYFERGMGDNFLEQTLGKSPILKSQLSRRKKQKGRIFCKFFCGVT